MRALAALVMLAAAAVSPDVRYFRYERPVQNIPHSGQACIDVDAALYAHAAPGLADVRLYRDRQETPYVLQTSSPPAAASEQSIALLDLGSRGGQTVFDAAMPAGSYGDLILNVSGQDFIATVRVTGSQQQGGPATNIGDYTIFDLTRQRLGRSTVLHLPPSDFRYLHFGIAGPLRPEGATGLSIARLTAGKPDYTTIAESKEVRLKGHSSIVEFTVPAHVPVDRVAVEVGSTPANFSRDATIEIRSLVPSPSGDTDEAPSRVSFSGNLLRVHTIENNHHIDQEHLEMAVPQPAFDGPSKWTLTIDNGDDAPLAPTSVRLEMMKRALCFEASGGNYALYYGDAKLSPPRYDLAQFLVVHLKDAAQASAGPEQENPDYQPRPDDRAFTEKHPMLLWIALAAVVASLGAIALRTAKSPRPNSG